MQRHENHSIQTPGDRDMARKPKLVLNGSDLYDVGPGTVAVEATL